MRGLLHEAFKLRRVQTWTDLVRTLKEERRRHNDGLCTLCNKLDDCYHLIFDCQRTEELRNHIKKIYPSSKEWTYNELMTDELVLEAIAGYVTNNKISI